MTCSVKNNLGILNFLKKTYSINVNFTYATRAIFWFPFCNFDFKSIQILYGFIVIR